MKRFLPLLAAAFLIRWFAPFIGYTFETDVKTFQIWASMLYNGGLASFYITDVFTDYPPMYMYVLYVVGAVRSFFGWDYLSLAFNRAIFMPAIICDLGIGYFIYVLANDKICHQNAENAPAFRWHILSLVNVFMRKNNFAVLLSAAWLLNPAVILNSAIWGQVDSVFALVLSLSLYWLIHKKLYLAYILFGIAILTKPQSLFVAPVYLYSAYIFLQEREFSINAFTQISLRILAAVACMVLLMLPFTQGFNFSPIINQYVDTLASYPYASINAYNFFTLIGGNWKPLTDSFLGLPYSWWGAGAIVFIIAASLTAIHKAKGENTYLFAAVLVMLVFMFSIKMHERYLFPALVFLLPAYIQGAPERNLAAKPGFSKQNLLNKNKRLIGLYAAFSITYFFNCLDVLFLYRDNLGLEAIRYSATILSAINLCLTGYMLYTVKRLTL